MTFSDMTFAIFLESIISGISKVSGGFGEDNGLLKPRVLTPLSYPLCLPGIRSPPLPHHPQASSSVLLQRTLFLCLYPGVNARTTLSYSESTHLSHSGPAAPARRWRSPRLAPHHVLRNAVESFVLDRPQRSKTLAARGKAVKDVLLSKYTSKMYER